MDKAQKELLDRHVKLFLSGDFDTLHHELCSIGFVSAASEFLSEEQLQKVQDMTRKRMHSMMNEITGAAMDIVKNTERGGTH